MHKEDHGAAWDAVDASGGDPRSTEELLALPFRKRLALYLHQRFPLLQHGILILSYFSANQFLAQAVTTEGRPMTYGPASWLNFLLLFCLFFHLRVFDEHKDRWKDEKAYPGRYLSRGVIAYATLWKLGLGAIAMELVLVLLAGPTAVFTWLVVLGWSLLMFKEFFLGEWLQERIFLYAVTHTTIMFFFDMIIWSITTGRWLWEVDWLFVLYAFNGVFVAFTFEFARKIRMPEDEHALVDSYSKRLGPHGAARLVLAVMAAATACTVTVGATLRLHGAFFVAIAVLLAGASLGFLHFRLRPNRKTAKRLELYSSCYIVSFDFCLVFALIAKYGIAVDLFGNLLRNWNP